MSNEKGTDLVHGTSDVVVELIKALGYRLEDHVVSLDLHVDNKLATVRVRTHPEVHEVNDVVSVLRLTCPLEEEELYAVQWAVEQAKVWRGSLVGNPDPEPLNVFDTMIARAEKALQKMLWRSRG